MAKPQTIFHVSREVRDRFTVLMNSTVRDPRLTWAQTGMLCHLLTMDETWVVRPNELATRKADGIKSVRSIIRGLIEAGYIRRRVQRGERGRITAHVYEVFETPQPAETAIPAKYTTNPLTASSPTASSPGHPKKHSDQRKTKEKNNQFGVEKNQEQPSAYSAAYSAVAHLRSIGVEPRVAEQVYIRLSREDQTIRTIIQSCEGWARNLPAAVVAKCQALIGDRLNDRPQPKTSATHSQPPTIDPKSLAMLDAAAARLARRRAQSEVIPGVSSLGDLEGVEEVSG